MAAGTGGPLVGRPRDLERHTLDNGPQVMLHRDPTLPLVALNIW